MNSGKLSDSVDNVPVRYRLLFPDVDHIRALRTLWSTPLTTFLRNSSDFFLDLYSACFLDYGWFFIDFHHPALISRLRPWICSGLYAPDCFLDYAPVRNITPDNSLSTRDPSWWAGQGVISLLGLFPPPLHPPPPPPPTPSPSPNSPSLPDSPEQFYIFFQS